MKRVDVVVIGGGIVGLATAYQITRQYPGRRVVVLEKEADLAHHQTGHNSGVLHTGIYYKPGSLKAVNCRAGKKAMEEFCAAEGIPFEICGKVIVAVDDSELPALERIFERGQANGVNCTKIDKARLAEIEPHAAGVSAHPRARGGDRRVPRGLQAPGRARARTRRRGHLLEPRHGDAQERRRRRRHEHHGRDRRRARS